MPPRRGGRPLHSIYPPRLNATLGREDKPRLDQFLTSVRELEQRVRGVASTMTPSDTITVSGYHGLQHAGDSNDGFATINWWLSSVTADLCQKLADIKEGDDSLLDNTLVLYAGAMHGSNHDAWPLPVVLFGGGQGGSAHRPTRQLQLATPAARSLFHDPQLVLQAGRAQLWGQPVRRPQPDDQRDLALSLLAERATRVGVIAELPTNPAGRAREPAGYKGFVARRAMCVAAARRTCACSHGRRHIRCPGSSEARTSGACCLRLGAHDIAGPHELTGCATAPYSSRPPFVGACNMMFVRCLVLVCAALLIPIANAQSGSGESATHGAAESPAYREAISDAISEYGAANYAEAREQFRRAHALSPSARTLRGLGITEFELRNYSAAATLLEQALASRVKPLEAAQRSEIESLLWRTRSYLGTVRLRMLPSTATFTVDGQETKPNESQSLSLEVGDHWFEFQAPGHARVRRRVRVDGGQDQLVKVELPDLHSESQAAQVGSRGLAGGPIEQQGADAPPPLYKRWWLWTTVGAVVVGGAVATALLLTRKTEQQEDPFRTDHTPPGTGIVLSEVPR